MRVLDASVVTDAVAVSGPTGVLGRRLLAQESWLHAPSILTAEVTSALRGMVRRGFLDPTDALVAARRVAQVRNRRHPFEPFLTRVWELRDDVTPYDARYVALAESLGAPLVTGDDRLRRAVGARCPIPGPEEALAAS